MIVTAPQTGPHCHPRTPCSLVSSEYGGRRVVVEIAVRETQLVSCTPFTGSLMQRTHHVPGNVLFSDENRAMNRIKIIATMTCILYLEK